MAVILECRYGVTPDQQGAFLAAARATLAYAEGQGALASLRRVLVGGGLANDHLLRLVFGDPMARAAYLDAEAGDPGLAAMALPCARRFLEEVPAAAAPRPQPGAISSSVWIPAPGREADADAALVAGTEVRRLLAIEAHVYQVQYGGAETGQRLFEIHGADVGKLTSDAAEVVANRARLGGLGPIPKAIQDGVMTTGAAVISVLVTP